MSTQNEAVKQKKQDLVEAVKAAFVQTGPEALEKVLTKIAERVHALETALGE